MHPFLPVLIVVASLIAATLAKMKVQVTLQEAKMKGKKYQVAKVGEPADDGMRSIRVAGCLESDHCLTAFNVFHIKHVFDIKTCYNCASCLIVSSGWFQTAPRAIRRRTRTMWKCLRLFRFGART
jgi:hypothetical protein